VTGKLNGFGGFEGFLDYSSICLALHPISLKSLRHDLGTANPSETMATLSVKAYHAA
jgi:hypothetical protein